MEPSLDDPVLYYGAPMPGTSPEHRHALFRDAFSIDDGASTPSPNRVQDAPGNSSDFAPKLTSTGVSDQELGLSPNEPPESPIF